MKKITLFSLLVIIALTMSSLYLIPHKEEITLYNEIPFPTAEFQELSPEEEISSTSEVEEFLVKESTFSEISEETQDDEKSASLDTTISLIEDNEPSEVIQIPNIELFAGSTDIQLTAEITTANQTVIVNKYFANTHSIDRGDGTATTSHTVDTTKIYTSPGTYTITLALTGTATRWTFQNLNKPLVPKSGTTASNVYVSHMPDLFSYFGTGGISVGNNFFYYFNYQGSLTSLSSGSFDTSNITTVGNNFFYYFNYQGSLTSLPVGSFDTSNITTVGDDFFYDFNGYGPLMSLPVGSFDTSNISTVGNGFFHYFNFQGSLKSLPVGSFDTSNITTVGNNFFSAFNFKGSLTSLPVGSFDTSNITTVGDRFFFYFNTEGSLTSLPVGSFNMSNITTVGEGFFSNFNQNGSLTSLPVGSFDTSNITTAGTNFFYYFNQNGSITNLPASFKRPAFNSTQASQHNNFLYTFSSPYTLNRNVADIINSGATPNSNRATFSENQPGLCDVDDNRKVDPRAPCTPSLAGPNAIQLTAIITTPGQTVTVNKYFANTHSIDRGDGTATTSHTVDTTKTYTSPGTYTITLALTGTATRWTFQTTTKPLVPKSLTTASNVYLSLIPDLSSYFGSNATNVGNYYFAYFNSQGALTSLPIGSFDTSSITTVGTHFFNQFNTNGQITSLPIGSFDTSNITTVGINFFNQFNSNGQLTSLPIGSFDTSKITTVGNTFFQFFNSQGSLTSLPSGSFNTSNISGVIGTAFFNGFNVQGALTSLPEGSFDTSKITGVGAGFFYNFNNEASLTSLPSGSFDTSNIITVGTNFFQGFNVNGQLTSLPTGSFDMSNITTVGDYFFSDFNHNGHLTSIPSSFKRPALNSTQANGIANFFNAFNSSSYTINKNAADIINGGATPNTNRATFSPNQLGLCDIDDNWKVNPLAPCDPSSIQLTAEITTPGQTVTVNKYFANTHTIDRGDGSAMTSHTADTTHTYTSAGIYIIMLAFTGGANKWTFQNGGIPLVPQAGTTVSDIHVNVMPDLSYFGNSATSVGNFFFNSFNNEGALTSFPDGSFDTSNITTVGDNFFSSFNTNSPLTSLPDRSFDTSNITAVGDNFFSSFNANSLLTSLPDRSFDIYNISTVGQDFFRDFNYDGRLTNLPIGSFNTSNINGTVGDNFFINFNYHGDLDSLPDRGFDTSNITAVGDNFFSSFNDEGALTSLSEGGFDTSNITTVGTNFFQHFNQNGNLTDLPSSFKFPALDVSNASRVGNFQSAFNSPFSTLNTSAPDILGDIATPNTNRATFSDNQPDRCLVHDNRLVTPCTLIITNLTKTPSTSTNGTVTLTLTTTGGSEIYEYSFDNGTTRQFGPSATFSSNTSGTGIVRDSVGRIASTGYTINNIIDSTIKLTAIITATNQTVQVNKYFANVHTINRGDGTATTNHTADTTKTYASAGTYTITLAFTGTATRWTFLAGTKPLVPKAGTTASNVYVSYMPAFSLFGTTATSAGHNFFYSFNNEGALTSLPVGSFDTRNIVAAGNYFFSSFNSSGSFTSLPSGSFNTSNINSITLYFFTSFNSSGSLTSLPVGSFDTSKITVPGNNFFASFNEKGSLTSLPTGSFNISNISGAIGNTYFFTAFNKGGSLTSLPSGSFDTSNMTSISNNCFESFNAGGALTSLPEGSFNTSKFISVTNGFFMHFNSSGSLTSLPAGSFDTSNITTVSLHFFSGFNYGGKLVDLPSSFKRPYLDSTLVGLTNNFLNAFNSPSYTLNRSVPLIISGIATPNAKKNTFSDNQPDRCLVHDNRLVNPCTMTITSLIQTPTTPTSGTVTLTLTVTGGSEIYQYSFDNGATRQSGASMIFTGNTSGTGIVRDSVGRIASTGYVIDNIIDPSSIQLTVITTDTNQTVKVNKYFANTHSINRGDGTATTNHTADTIKTYASAGTYTITLSLTGSATRWTFQNVAKPLVPQALTTASNVYVSAMPDLFSYFGTGGTSVGDYFFSRFNYQGSLTSLPVGSFDTSNITTVGIYFFNAFNAGGFLTSLPVGSFDTNNITTVGNRFFQSFNEKGSLISLPVGSFDTSNITTVGNTFFYYFNYQGSLASLPVGSFDTSNITTVGDRFFYGFNQQGSLSSLPVGSFDTSNITTVGDRFFSFFNSQGSLTSLPSSFKFPALDSTKASLSNNFFSAFDSPSFTLNTSVPLIINGSATPNTNRSTFSDNQPDRCLVHDNRLVTPCTLTITNLTQTPTTPTSGTVTLTLTVTGGSEIYQYSFDNGATRQSGASMIFTGNASGTGIVRDSTGRMTSTGYNITNIDTTAPVCGTWTPSDGIFSGILQFTLTGSTDGESGIAVAGGICTVTPIGTDCSITISDNVGNITICASPTASCATGYTQVGNACVPTNQTQDCVITNGSGEQHSIDGGITRGICTVINCNSGYIGVGNTCEADTQTEACTGLPVNAQRNTVANIIQTRNGSEWTPSLVGTYNITPSVSECRFKCNTNYTRNNSSCEKTGSTQNGAGGGLQPDYCPDGDFSPSYYDRTCDTPGGDDNYQEEYDTSETKNEVDTAYQRAYKYDITTQSPLHEADPNGFLIRSHLAKMIVNYVINILNKEPDLTKDCSAFTTSIQGETLELQKYMTLACQYNIMGINPDTTPLSDFLPNQIVSRAEFGTVLSRILRGDTYNDSNPYYVKHLQSLKDHKIMIQIDNPLERKELRRWIWIMLMRSIES